MNDSGDSGEVRITEEVASVHIRSLLALDINVATPRKLGCTVAAWHAVH